MWHSFARQLSNPRGVSGWVVGKLMKLANRQPTRLAINALDIRPGDDVLDLGCGPGQAVEQMLPLATPGRVLGIDQSETMIRDAGYTNRHAVKAGRSAFTRAEFSALPFAEDSFDRILASNVMYFWHETAPILAEIRRVLRPGGKISIYLTSAKTMKHWKIAGAGTHRLFDAADVERALTESGFSSSHMKVEKLSLSGGVEGLLATAWLD